MKIFFVKRAEEYLVTTKSLYYWDFVKDRDLAQMFFSWKEADNVLNYTIDNDYYLARDNPTGAKRSSYKIVSIRGELALKYLMLRLNERLEKIEGTLKEHKL